MRLKLPMLKATRIHMFTSMTKMQTCIKKETISWTPITCINNIQYLNNNTNHHINNNSSIWTWKTSW